jgi:hypothetical protein
MTVMVPARFHVLTAASMKMRAFWDVAIFIALTMKAVRSSETSVCFYKTTRLSSSSQVLVL